MREIKQAPSGIAQGDRENKWCTCGRILVHPVGKTIHIANSAPGREVKGDIKTKTRSGHVGHARAREIRVTKLGTLGGSTRRPSKWANQCYCRDEEESFHVSCCLSLSVLNHGRNAPDCDRTLIVSPMLIIPSTFTSQRKLVASVTSPERLRVWIVSPTLTNPLPSVSPTSTPISAPTSPVLVPSFTPSNVIVILCAVITPVRLTVTIVVPLPLLPLTVPTPVTVALLKVTELAKVKTTW